MKKLFELIGMIVGLVGGIGILPVYADTNVSGIISTNTVWDTAGSPYIVTENVLVDTLVRLDIQPGVEVKIDEARYIMVKGTLNAIGTATDSIIITKNGTARWSKLWFKSASICSLKYCRIEYASGSAIYNEADSLYIGYCTISNNSGYFGDGGGVYNSGSATITDNTISNNSAYYSGGGIRNHGSATITGNTISNNSAYYCGGIYNFFSATITGNTISNNSGGSGGGIYNSGSATIRYNTITDTTSFAIYLDDSAFIRTNNIYATGYAVYNNISSNIDARYNYWNTTDTATINTKIWDYYDNSVKGKVFYQPLIDEAFSDITAPSAPLNLTANGSNPSPETNDSIFVINWTNPADPSGISEYYYKLGSEPTSDFDITGIFHSAPDTVFSAGGELYVWLVDSSGNLNYQNRASVMLNYVGIEENAVPPQRDVASLQILKNPFIKSTVIRYSLPEYTNICLTVYDLSGREVRKLVNGKQKAGSYEFNFEDRGLTTGAYFLVLNAGENKLTKKIIVIK